MSQNSTVTCFNSPGSGAPPVAGRATVGLGVLSRSMSPPSEAPHWPQNRLSGGLAAPHDEHADCRGAPHSPQNFIPAGFSAWHRKHLMPSLDEVAGTVRG